MNQAITTPPPTLVNDQSITVFFPGVPPKTILSTSPSFEAAKQCLIDKDWDILLELMDPISSITQWGKGNLTVINGMIHIDGEPLASEALNQKVVSMWEAGFPIEPYMAFNERLLGLKSHRISKTLFPYIERHSFPLFEDGAFMAYKGLNDNQYKDKELTGEEVLAVYRHSPQNPYTYINGRKLSDMGYYRELLQTKDYLDVHSKSVPQSVGDTVSMDVRQVNDDPNVGCSTGLHVGSNSYTCNYGTRILVKIYPVNCIAVPSDCEFSKIRVDKYTLMEIDTSTEGRGKSEYTRPMYSFSVSPTFSEEEDDTDEDEDYDADYDEDDEE